ICHLPHQLHTPNRTDIAERCEQATAQSNFQKFGVREPVRISIGLTHTDRLENDPLQSLQWKADVAMYSAKRPS
ncbi:hypothetical protein QQ73_16245, partial [Candidatus Endoriftia persephone str. Guaymas]|nr:hypothetical protein [Candidatus Endoriftia persephone str. Guaymas]